MTSPSCTHAWLKRTFVCFAYALILILPGQVFSQVGIGTTSPNSKAVLDLSSNNKGLLIPRMSTAQRTAILSPPKGLLVFDNDSSYVMYYDGSTWKGLQGSSSVPNYWKRSGNYTNLAKSTDSIGIGKTPLYKVDVKGPVNADSLMIGGYSAITFRNTNFSAGISAGTNSSSTYSTYLGYYAGGNSTSGYGNTFTGYATGYNTTGGGNTFYGYAAGYTNTTGASNNFSGYLSGYYNTSGALNTFSGFYSGFSNNTGSYNLFEGYEAGYYNTSGQYNTSCGYLAGFSNTTGIKNTCVGAASGYSNTTGQYNTFSGINTGHENTTGSYNSLYGGGANYNTTTGTGNSSLGFEAGHDNFTGNYNTNLGYRAGYHDKGTHNIFIGDSADANSFTTYNNAIAIGWNSIVAKSNSIVLGNNNVNVGIGTSTPAFKLDVHAAINADTFLVGGARALFLRSASLYLGPNAGGSGTGVYNVFAGLNAGFSNGTGHSNVGVGIAAGAVHSGSQNTFIGDSADAVAGGLTNATAIGYNAKVSQSNSLVLGNVSTSVGIGTGAPATTLEVDGFTMLGASAPKIQVLKLTGTTASTQGSAVTISHGLSSSKILSVNVMVAYSSGNYVPPSYNGSTGYEFNWYLNSSGVTVWNTSSNSSSILSKAITILIVYEQ